MHSYVIINLACVVICSFGAAMCIERNHTIGSFFYGLGLMLNFVSCAAYLLK